ncbi:MAG TPA: acylase [Ktedonobacteraceae bacterium]|jgi:acyl-homoserine-lactone acylase|nr:acylase [Ktedonobacteraceae bacterium]
MHVSLALKKDYFRRLQLLFLPAILVLSLCLSSCTTSTDASAQSPNKQSTSILWDSWGVPHIFAANDEQLFYSFGYAQMQNHADLLLTLYGEARGRAAEYWGASYLGEDEFVRTMGFPEHAQSWYNAQTPAFRRYITAFVAGMNAYAHAHPDQISPQMRVVLPLQVTDVFAHGERVFSDFLLGDCEPVLNTFNVGTSSAGSNGWAIGPAHSASNHAMLLANPHLPWSGETTFFEAQLVSPTTSMYGATLVGFPVLAIAFNNFLSWTHTVNTIDACDAYKLTLSGNGYLFDNTVHTFATQTETLRVKQTDGTLKSQQLTIRHSVHGPVFTFGKGDQTETLAIRMTGVDQFPATGMWQEWWDMGHAQNLSQFQSAVQRLQIPMFTIIYADRDGHVLSLFNGEVPKRPSGDWNYWTSIVPGDTSATLWNSIIPYKDLPKVIDPPSDWVQNSNSPPWYTTFPQTFNPAQYPAYLAPVASMSLREQSGVEMITAQNRLSYEQMVADKFSSHVVLADRLVPDLIAAAHKYGNAQAQQAADVLQAWDRTTDANSKGAALFYVWASTMLHNKTPLFMVPWDPKQPRTTPSGLADPQAAVQVLQDAASTLLSQVGSLDIPWGTAFRVNRGSVNLPASGGPGDPFGIFRALYFASGPNGQYIANSGDSYIAAVEFTNPIQARVLLTYGNSSQPDSPHNGDQLTLYAKNQMRDAWLTQSEIEAHLASRVNLF